MNRLLAKYSDILLAAGVVVIIMLLVIRIDPGVIDYLIATNIAVAVIILLTALYIPDAKKLPSFPTLLLLTTLFRLGLNVSTTRLILLEANAGDIIFAFGDFVVGGNFVVGAVVFIVLVVIQFVVIAKGSERVAEVAARFTLDAMPGKQMAIDADMRNGLIGPEEGKARRQDLERESKLYGAMDGAMKFVKGDAIAGIIISLINIIGGLVVGVMQQGMTAGEAVQLYALLTIGDGLVSQIPALLISVSAGLVVTRVAQGPEDQKGHVARDIVSQLLSHPKAIVVAAVLLVLSGASSPWTGFPMIPFIGLGVLAALVSVPILAAPLRREQPAEGEAPEGEAPEEEEGEERTTGPVPLSLQLHQSLEHVLAPPGDPQRQQQVREQLKQIRGSVSRHLGIPIPPIVFRVGDPRLTMNSYAISILDAPVDSGTAAPMLAVALCTPDHAAQIGLSATPGRLP